MADKSLLALFDEVGHAVARAEVLVEHAKPAEARSVLRDSWPALEQLRSRTLELEALLTARTQEIEQVKAEKERAFRAGYHCQWIRSERRYVFDPALKPGDPDGAFAAWQEADAALQVKPPVDCSEVGSTFALSGDHELLNAIDGVVWAHEFCRITGFADEGWAISWFCNAIMTGFDEANRRARQREAEERASKPDPCESCGKPADGYTADDVPICQTCAAELSTTESSPADELAALVSRAPQTFTAEQIHNRETWFDRNAPVKSFEAGTRELCERAYQDGLREGVSRAPQPEQVKERCAQIAEAMAVGPWGGSHDAIAPGSLAKMIAREIRDSE